MRCGTILVACLGAIAAAIGPAAASAQVLAGSNVLPEGQGVADRVRAEFQPIGGRFGSFFLYPRVSLSSVVTDNVRATDSNRRSDVYGVLRGDAQLVSRFSRNSLNASLFASQSVHARLPAEDATQFGGQLDGTLDATRDTRLHFVGRGEHLIEERSSYNNIQNARSPSRYDHYLGQAAIDHDFDPVTVSATAGYERYVYQPATTLDRTRINQRYRDFEQLSGDMSALYTFSPGYALVVRGTIDKRSYLLPSGSPLNPGGFDRDSSGGRLEAGVRFDLTRLFFGEVRAGYLVRNLSDPRFKDTSGLSFGANLLWNVTPVATLRLVADRRIDEASSTTSSGNRRTMIDLYGDYELLRSLIVGGTIGYARNQPVNVTAGITPLNGDASSTEYEGQLSATYLANRRLSARAAYLYNRRSSASTAIAFREQRVTTSVILQF